MHKSVFWYLRGFVLSKAVGSAVGLRVVGAEVAAVGATVAAAVGVREGGVNVTPVSPCGVDPEFLRTTPPTTATTTATTTKATIANTRTVVTVYSEDRRLYQGRLTGGPLIQS
jgi:hypothetical protein